MDHETRRGQIEFRITFERFESKGKCFYTRKRCCHICHRASLSNQRVLSSLASPSVFSSHSARICPTIVASRMNRRARFHVAQKPSIKCEIDKVSGQFPSLSHGLKIIQLILDYTARVCSMKLLSAIRPI